MYLEDAILSVLNQNYPSLEYIIIDGGSTDESVDIMRRYSDNIQFWCSESDEGQSHALIKGFERSKYRRYRRPTLTKTEGYAVNRAPQSGRVYHHDQIAITRRL